MTWSDDAEPQPERPPFRRSFAIGLAAAFGLAAIAALLALASPTVAVGGQTVACWAPALGMPSGTPAPVAEACAAPTTARLVVSTVLAIAALVMGAITTIRATTVPRVER